MPDPLDTLRAALAGRYAVERELGRGGAATVYLGRDLRHERQVAIKVIAADVARELGAERFVREIGFAAQLTHPHILPLFDSGAADGLLFYVMPFVEGESLRDRLRRTGPLAVDEAVRIALEIASALSYAHARNIVHRDIKPENILLEAGHAVVADFGIARAMASAGTERLTGTGMAVGTPAYMSPEQASGDERLDGRSDIYSLGCVLYEMLGGEPPVTGPSPRAILARQIAGEIRSLRPLRPGVPEELDAVVRHALATEPADRFATAEELASALEPFRSAAWAPDGRLAHRRRAPLANPRVRRAVLVGAGALAVLVLAAVAVRGVVAGRRAAAARGLAIFPFQTYGGAEDWAEALADLLSTTLDGTPGLRVVDPWALWRPLRASRASRAVMPSPDEAERLTQRVGARHFLLGSLADASGTLRLTLRIYRSGGTDPPATLSVEAPADSMSALIRRAAVAVIERLAPAADGAAPSWMERNATDSVEALKAYLEARGAMRRGQIEQADAAISRALAIDTAFALAAVEAITIRSWLQFTRGQPYTGLRELAQLALRHQHRLGERQRMRAQLAEAMVEGDGPRAADLASRIVQLDGADVDAWVTLAFTHLVYGWQYGATPRDALDAAERAIRLDSTHVPALVHRAHLAAELGSPEDMRAQIARLRHADSAQSIVRASALALESLLRDDAAFETLLDTIVAEPPERWITVLRYLRSYRLDRAERLLDRLRAQPGAGFPKRAATGAHAQLLLAEGRVVEIDAALREGRYADSPMFERQLDGALLAAALVGVSDDAVTGRALASLEAYLPVDSAAVHFTTRPVVWLGWILAAYHATLGDTSEARRWHAAFGTLPAGGSPATWREALQADIDARLAARRGELRVAIREADRAFRLWRIHDANEMEYRPAPAMRLHLAQLLRSTGDADSAAAIFRSLVPPTTWMGPLTARASLELARLAEARGARDEAAAHYAVALRFWERGGATVQSWRAEAEAGLRRVGPEPRSIPMPQ